MYMYFHYFVIISPWKRAGLFIWTNLNSLHPWMLCTKFGWNWHSCSDEEDFWISSMYQVFLLFCYHLPLEKGATLHWHKLASLLPKNGFCKVWLDSYIPPLNFVCGGGGMCVIRNNQSCIRHWKKYTDIISLEVIDQF